MRKILLNIMYTGKYISETTKIGHEIINLFKDDKGRNFIYITPYGYISSEHNGQVDTVIMARGIGDGLVEVFSNLFAYFFAEYPKLFKKFAKELLGITVSGEISIAREEANIDLLITDERNYVVIENKVKSKINGVGHDIYGDGVQSQLKKYYNYAEEHALGRCIGCFIFAPDYNRIDVTKFACGSKYEVIKYSQIYNFFAKNGQLAMHSKYYSELLLALYPHTKTVYNDFEAELKRRFARVIRRIV